MSNLYNRAVRLVQQVSKTRTGNESPVTITVHKQSVERAARSLTKITKLCANPLLELTVNPPSLQEILLQLDCAIAEIIDTYEQSFHILNECEYFRVFLANLISKLGMLKRLLLQFDYSRQSDHRRSLTRYTMTLQHLICELHNIFPNGRYSENQARSLMSKEAATWWIKTFGNRTIVPWREFIDQFGLVHKLRGSSSELLALQKTIDLTSDGYVSIVEFDTFVRLYQPWINLIPNWNKLAVAHPGYFGYATYEELRTHLEHECREPGAYAFRMSCTKVGQWAIGYVSADLTVVQTLLHDKTLTTALTEGYDRKLYRLPNGLRDNPNLNAEFAPDSVTDSQYENFVARFGSLIFTFCEKCSVFSKTTTQLPCFHAVCTPCIILVTKHNTVCSSLARSCPICFVGPQVARQSPAFRVGRASKKENRRSLAISGDDSPLLSHCEQMASFDDFHLSSNWSHITDFDTRALLNDRNMIPEEDPFNLSAASANQRRNLNAMVADVGNTNTLDSSTVTATSQNSNESSSTDEQPRASRRPSFVISQMMKDYFYSRPRFEQTSVQEAIHSSADDLFRGLDDQTDQMQGSFDIERAASVASPTSDRPLIDLDGLSSPVSVAKKPSDSIFQDFMMDSQQTSDLEAMFGIGSASSQFSFSSPQPQSTLKAIEHVPGASISTLPVAAIIAPSPAILCPLAPRDQAVPVSAQRKPITPPPSPASNGFGSASIKSLADSAMESSTLIYIDEKIRGMLENAKGTKLTAHGEPKRVEAGEETAMATAANYPCQNDENQVTSDVMVVEESEKVEKRMPKINVERASIEVDEIGCFASSLGNIASMLTSEKREMLVRLIPGLKRCRCSVSCCGFQLTSDTIREIEEILIKVGRD